MIISKGNSDKSFLFELGMNTVETPPLNAANNFSFRPPIRRTSPTKVTSHVIAMSLLTGILEIADIMAIHIPIPAEGPSLGVDPSGT